MTLHDFKFFIGEIVMFCQIIEADIKIIYVNLLGKDKQVTWELIEKETLGSMVKKLQELDSHNRLLSKESYHYLHQMVGVRNHWCHQTYTNFLFNGANFEHTTEYLNEINKLVNDHHQLSQLYHKLEKIRVDVVRKSINK